MGGVTVASFNVHSGVDGWGRPFDVVEACAHLDADVIVMQEDWAAGSDGPGLSDLVAQRLGYVTNSETLAHGWRYPVPADATPRFGPPRLSGRTAGVRLDRGPSRRGRSRLGPQPAGSERGRWRLAVLTRLPVRGTQVIALAQLRRDPARRVALVIELDTCGSPLTVVGVHMPHLKHGSPLNYAELRRALRVIHGSVVVAGDMNLSGPALRLLLPGWRDTVKGRTWPSWRPLAQPDHILVNASAAHEPGHVVSCGGSDHLAIRASVYSRLIERLMPEFRDPLAGAG